MKYKTSVFTCESVGLCACDQESVARTFVECQIGVQVCEYEYYEREKSNSYVDVTCVCGFEGAKKKCA